MTHFQLIKSDKNFRILWIIDFLMTFGSWFTLVALYTLLVRFESSPFFIATVSAFHWIPGAIQAPIVGIVLDRVDTKKLLNILLFLELILTLLFLFIDSKELLWLILPLVFFRMSCASFIFTAIQSFTPKFIPSKSLRVANELIAFTWSLTFVLGMVLGGFAVDSFGTSFSFVLDALFFAIGLIVLRKLEIPQSIVKAKESFSFLLKSGLVYLKENRDLIKAIFLHAAVGFTAFDALVTLLAKNSYSTIISEPLGIGLINGVRAVALFLGPLFFSRFQESKKLLFWLFVAQGIGIIIWALLQDNLYISFIGIFITGLFTTSIWSITFSEIQKKTEKEYLGSVIAYNDMVFLLASALTSFMIGILATFSIPLFWITIFLGSLFLLSSLFI